MRILSILAAFVLLAALMAAGCASAGSAAVSASAAGQQALRRRAVRSFGRSFRNASNLTRKARTPRRTPVAAADVVRVLRSLGSEGPDSREFGGGDLAAPVFEIPAHPMALVGTLYCINEHS